MPVNQKISQLPPSPSFSKRPESFDSDGENWSEAIDPMTEELNTMADEINDTQQEINTSEAAAAQSVLDCQTELGNCQSEVQLAKAEVTLAAIHKAKAKQWSDENQNTEVEPGQYSSKHWALVAKDYTDNMVFDPRFSSSTTSIEILPGVINLTIETGKTFLPDMWVAIISRTDPLAWVKGYIGSYDSGTGAMVVNGMQISGGGTYDDWLVTQTNPSAPSSSGITAIGLFTMQSFS